MDGDAEFGSLAGQGSLSARLGRLAGELLQQEGLDEVAGRVLAAEPLAADEALRLTALSLPLLGKLVELVHRPPALDDPRIVDPVDEPIVQHRVGDECELIRRLVELRDRLGPERRATWCPVVQTPLDQTDGVGDGVTGIEVLRAIALARLLLPRDVRILAPLSRLGVKTAHAALSFGASHLGTLAPSEAGILDELIETVNWQ